MNLYEIQTINVLVAVGNQRVRDLLCRAVCADRGLHLVGVCADARELPAMVGTVQADVLVIDLQQTGALGSRLIRKVSQAWRVPLVAVAAHNNAALRVMDAGAVDFVYMPVSGSDSDEGWFVRQVLQRVKIGWLENMKQKPPPPERDKRCIAVSAAQGGVAAVAYLLKHLHAVCPPVVVHQHRPELFRADYGTRLAMMAGRPVVPAQDGILASGSVHVVPDGCAAQIGQVDGLASLTLCTSCGLPADRMFASAADAFGGEAAAVYLGGHGADGVAGLKCVAEARGLALAHEKNAILLQPKLPPDGAVRYLSLEDIAEELRDF